jgi:predicted nucleic acid-binding protein
MPLLLDTGVLYALADADDAWHARCRDYVAGTREAFVVPVTVLPEVAYLLRERLGAREEREFVRALARDPLRIETTTRADFERCVDLLEKYPHIGFVDASVVAVAERLGLPTIATTDRRDFGPIRPRHVPAFELVP